MHRTSSFGFKNSDNDNYVDEKRLYSVRFQRKPICDNEVSDSSSIAFECHVQRAF